MKMNLTDKFWKKVKIGKPNECWPWIGNVNDWGYGQTTHLGKRYRAHRLANTLIFGKIPVGLMVLHKCDNPPCCNPNHHFRGTAADNARDASQKGRLKGIFEGEKHPRVKLRNSDIIEIRQKFKHGIENMPEMAKKFSVTKTQIFRIVIGRSWRHIGGPIHIPGHPISNPKKKRTWNRIHKLRRSGMSQQKIANATGIDQGDISRILNGKRWTKICLG